MHAGGLASITRPINLQMRSQSKKNLDLPSRSPRRITGQRPFAKQITREAKTSPRAFSFPSEWQRERAVILQRICKSIKTRREKGITLHCALSPALRYWKNRLYKSAPKKKIRLSRPTLT